MTKRSLKLDGVSLTVEELARFESERSQVTIVDDARERMLASVDTVRRAVESGRAAYGITTGFGAFARKHISKDQVTALQYNLVRSHACGIGEPLPAPIVRRMMLLKANSLAVGASGIRPEVVDTLLALLNHDVLPRIPERGSVGASGDLAPLAHLALALIGEGEADHKGKVLRGADVLRAAGVKPVELQAKEGLALLNGTQLSTALAVEGLLRVTRLMDFSIAAGALSLEALAGSYTPFDRRIHAARRLVGQQAVAEKFREWLTGSDIHDSHAGCDRVQDPYSLRCMPQVIGAVFDTAAHAQSVLEMEINGVSDNPLIFDDDVVSGGNFHAEPIAFVSDFLAIAATELGTLSERRTDLLTRQVNPNLPMFLAAQPGLESGFMIAQVTAAALASENKTLAHPASVDTIPTSAGQEDHVSMAPWAGLKLLRICDNLDRILAIELMAAAAAIDFLRPLKTTLKLEALHGKVRAVVKPHTGDRRLDQDIEALAALVNNGL